MKKLMLMFAAAVALIGFMGCGASESDICSTACQLISEQYASLEGESAPTCQNVKLVKKVSDRSWHAKATLSNGKTIQVLVTCEDDIVTVDMTAQAIKDFNEEVDQALEEFNAEIDQAQSELESDFD